MIMNLFTTDDIDLIEEEMSFFATIPLIEDSKFVGWSKDVTVSDDGRQLGHAAKDGFFYIPVFIVNFCPTPISDEIEQEKNAIDNGKNCAIFLHGNGEESYVMRFTSKELKSIDLSFFDNGDIDAAFFYRS